jgi:hypothetical protein
MENSRLKICVASVIFKKLAKVNNHPIGENSPNLATLISSNLHADLFFTIVLELICTYAVD